MRDTFVNLTRWLGAVQASTLGRSILALIVVLTSALLADASAPTTALLIFGTLGSTATADGLLKDFYDDEWIQEGVNNRRPLKDVIDDKMMDKRYGGRRVIYPFHIKRNISPFFSSEYGLFAEADVQNNVQVTVDARKMIGRTILTQEAIDDSAQSEMAWEDFQEQNFDKILDDFARRDELSLSYTGQGVLARINDGSPSGAANMGVDSPGGIAGSVFGNRFIQVGSYVGAINPATGGLRAGISKVASVSTDGTSVTFTAAPNGAWTDNDFLVKAANSTVTDPLDTEYESWFWGVLSIFDDGTYRGNYGGIDRTLVDNVNSYVNASTGVLSMDTMQMLADVLDQRSGGITSLMLAHHSVRRLVIKLTQPDRRYAGEDLRTPDPGTVAFKQGDITIGEVPIKAIRDFAYGTLLGIDVEKAKFRRYISNKGEWVRSGSNGDIFVRVGAGPTARHAFEAWYFQRWQYWAKFPAAAWRADGITGATVTVARPLGD